MTTHMYLAIILFATPFIIIFLLVAEYLYYRHKQAIRIANKEIDQIRNQRGW